MNSSSTTIPAADDRVVTHDSDIAGLSPRRREILDLIAQGQTNEEIAAELRIAEATVRSHVTAVFNALGVSNRTQAAMRLLAANAVPDEVERFMARPAIAVLPTLHDDSRGASSLAIALSQELESLFARWCWFPVIARSATRGARDLGPTAEAIGAALTARYLVDPALRATRGGWRFTVHVHDAENGHTVWLDRRDFDDDPLAMLDDACTAIVAAAYSTLIRRTCDADHGPRPTDVTAWQLAHEAHELQRRRDRTASREAAAIFTGALARDPQLVLAHLGLGLCAYDAILNQWGPPDEARALLAACAERCVELAPHAAEGYFLLGRYHQTLADNPSAAIALEHAVARNPSFADAYALLAQTLALSGRSDEALERMRQAHRLAPRSFVAGLATLHFARGDYAEALAAAKEAVALRPSYTFSRVMAVTAAWWANDHREAQLQLAQLVESHPAFDADRLLEIFGPGLPAVEQFSEGVRRTAQLPALTRD